MPLQNRFARVLVQLLRGAIQTVGRPANIQGCHIQTLAGPKAYLAWGKPFAGLQQPAAAQVRINRKLVVATPGQMGGYGLSSVVAGGGFQYKAGWGVFVGAASLAILHLPAVSAQWCALHLKFMRPQPMKRCNIR